MKKQGFVVNIAFVPKKGIEVDIKTDFAGLRKTHKYRVTKL
jgi:hypothetical protein